MCATSLRFLQEWGIFVTSTLTFPIVAESNPHPLKITNGGVPGDIFGEHYTLECKGILVPKTGAFILGENDPRKKTDSRIQTHATLESPQQHLGSERTPRLLQLAFEAWGDYTGKA